MSLKTLIFATSNAHKLEEVTAILDNQLIELKSLKDIGYNQEIEETGSTLSENATIKSKTIFESIGGNVFSEDTGLEVMSLGMAPGVITARYAGPQRNAEDNMNKLLEELEDGRDRTARFKTVLSLIWEGEEYLFEGIVNGTIATKKKGDTGFGYDPIFIPFGHEKTFAELPAATKNSISHRYRAVMQMKSWLANSLK